MRYTTMSWGCCMFLFFITVTSLYFFVFFRIASLLRLHIPLLYALIIPTVFHEWYYTHTLLANGIWYAMLAVVAVSWVITIARKVREWI